MAGLVIERTEQRERRRFEAYTRGSLYALIALVSCWAVIFIAPRAVVSPAHWLTAVLVGAHGAVSFVAARRLLWTRPLTRRFVLGYAALSVAAAVALAASGDPDDLYRRGAAAFTLASLILLQTFSVAGLVVPWRRAWPLVVLGALLVAVALALRGVAATGVVVGAFSGLVCGIAGVLGGALTMWMMRVVRVLDESRELHARLAVAEERLRFARDLHDVYGRTLSTISMKCQLAAELARRGDERAPREIEEVGALAHASLGQLRGIVHGYRGIDLAVEIDGARSLLRSAGVRVRIEGAQELVGTLDGAACDALAWVVREATTNVIRHSTASAVSIRAAQSDDSVTLEIANDGAPPENVKGQREGAPAGGTGLVGLRERLDGVGGRLRTTRDRQRYVLTATVPAAATVPVTVSSVAGASSRTSGGVDGEAAR